MTTELYSYLPRPGEMIAVDAVEGAEQSCLISVMAEFVSVKAGSGGKVSTTIPDEDVPAVARKIQAAMHEAAGLPVPAVLDRLPALLPPGAPKTIGGLGVIRHGRLTQVRDLMQSGGIAPGTLRELAGYLAACADAAENEPDPADVETLAAVLAKWLPLSLLRITGEPLGLARAVLAAGYTPPERP